MNYAFSDLHGNYNLCKQILSYCKPDDNIYCLGDCIDRGKSSKKTLDLCLQDKRVTLIKGNHEDFFVTEFPKLLKNFDPFNIWLDENNGGLETYLEFRGLYPTEIKKYIKTLSELPELVKIKNKNNQAIYLSHAGFNPNQRKKDLLWDRTHIYNSEIFNGKYNNIYIVHGHTPTNKIQYAYGHKFNIDAGTYITNKANLLNLDTWEVITFEDNGLV